MTAYLFYTPGHGPEARKVQEYEAQLALNKVATKLVDFDSREGTDLRELYDVTSHPAVVLARMDGSIIEKWQHELPLVSEVSYLAHS